MCVPRCWRTGLSWVSQGNCPSCQGRAFHYYGTGWLKDASNGESGVTSYTYDNAGNVKTRTDNRNIVTTYSYDALNRLTAKQYSDGVTPTVGLAYDGSGNVAYGKGHLVWMSDGTSATTFANFDALGRVTQSYQQMAGQTYNFGYNWNLANGLTSETYPSGRVLTTTYDAANRPQAVSGTLGSLTTAYASGVSYAPHGGPAKYEFGNHIWRTFTYSSRLQPNCWWDAVNDSPSAYLLTLCPGWGTTNNNGTLQSMTVQAGGPGPLSSLPTFSTNYSYDNVNRVSSASDSGGWSRSFHYDQYGNLWTTGASGTPISGLMPTANVYNGNNQITGNAYDGAGNLTALGTYTLVYDAENRLTQATDAPSAGGGSVQYFYDAVGQRVMKQFAGGARTVYVYDALGQMAAEYSSAAADTVTPACGTCYLTTDHLGSTRLVTDADGNVVARHDYLPFGEEVPAGSAGRTGQWGAFDSVSQKFTGQERDSETGLDFFQARHFSNVLGRFLSADPGNAGANLYDPQTWNAYAYVRNNPLALVDPSGMDATDPGDDCFSDPTCGGGGWWNFPPIDFPWPTSMPIPPPPPQPSPTVIQNAGGVYGQGQWGSYPNDGETLGLPPGMSVPGPLSPQALLNLWDWDCSSGVCVPGFAGNDFAPHRAGNAEPTTLNLNIDVKGLLRIAGTAICGSHRSTGEQVFRSVRNGAAKGIVGGALNGAGAPAIPLLIPNIMGSLELGAEAGVVGGPIGAVTGALIGGAACAASGVVIGLAKSAACNAAGF